MNNSSRKWRWGAFQSVLSFQYMRWRWDEIIILKNLLPVPLNLSVNSFLHFHDAKTSKHTFDYNGNSSHSYLATLITRVQPCFLKPLLIGAAKSQPFLKIGTQPFLKIGTSTRWVSLMLTSPCLSEESLCLTNRLLDQKIQICCGLVLGLRCD